MNITCEYRNLGKSDLKISPIGLGCWQFSKRNGLVGKYWSKLSSEEIKQIVKISLEGGINWFDTAEAYGWGESEKALDTALKELGSLADHAMIATKWWPIFRSASSISGTIQDRINCLGGRKIHLYQIHQPYSVSSIESQMKEMAKLVREGKVLLAGVSNFSEKQMREAHRVLADEGIPLVSNQVKYSLLDRRIEQNGILEAAKELGITIIAYSPLEQGILTGKFHQNPTLVRDTKGPRRYMSSFRSHGLKRTQSFIDVLEEIAQKRGRTISQVALNWLIHAHGDTIVTIPGASKLEQAKDNVGALQFRLTEDEIKEIDAASQKVAKK